jgi:23S rRNA pseudouridine2605 synthase
MGVLVNDNDEIIVDGKILYEQDPKYYLINKPINYICSRKDNFNRPIVTDLAPTNEKVFPIGRLDYNTSGLLILTNDGYLANGLMHPKFKIQKTYIAKVKGAYTKQDLIKLSKGVVLEGKKTLPAKVVALSYDHKSKIGKVEITIFEGRNLQVRKMFEVINSRVLELKRVKYGFIDLREEKRLPTGSYRELKAKEIQKLYSLIESDTVL